MLRVNVYSDRPYILKTHNVHAQCNCALCTKQLSEFTDIVLFASKESEKVKGRMCVDCDVIYVTDKIPDKCIQSIKNKFEDKVEVSTLKTNKKKEVSKKKHEGRGVQGIPIRTYKTMVTTGGS